MNRAINNRGLSSNRKPVKSRQINVPYNLLPPVVKKNLGAGKRLIVSSYYEAGSKLGEWVGYNTYSVYRESDNSLVFEYTEKTKDNEFVLTPPELPPLPNKKVFPPEPPPPPLMPITPENRGLPARKKTVYFFDDDDVVREPTQENPEPIADVKEDGYKIPSGPPDIGTAVSGASTALDILASFGITGGAIGATATILLIIAAMPIGYWSAAEAASGGARMTRLLAVCFATTAWVFQHPLPKYPSALEKSTKLEVKRKEFETAWRKAVKKQTKLLDEWFEEKYFLYYKKQARNRERAADRLECRNVITESIRISAQEFAKELVNSDRVTKQLFPAEKKVYWKGFSRIEYPIKSKKPTKNIPK